MPVDHNTSDNFTARIELVHDQHIVLLPSDVSTRLPSRGQVAVDASINGLKQQIVVEPDGYRGHWIRIDAEIVSAAHLEPGDEVQIHIAVCEHWPEPNLPDDLAAALAAAPDITDLWSSITPMARWEWVRWVNATANPATRERRVEVSISKLRSGKRRPCCFDLSSCTDPHLSKSGKLRI